MLDIYSIHIALARQFWNVKVASSYHAIYFCCNFNCLLKLYSVIPKKRDEKLSVRLIKLFGIKLLDSIFLESIYVVCIIRCALNDQIYIIFVIWLSCSCCRNGKLKKIWQFSYHEKCVWWLWLGLTIRVTHRIYWPKSNVKFIMHALWNAFFFAKK